MVFAMFALLCFSGVVLAGQNTNSSTTMEPRHEMSSMGRRGRRHRRQRRMRHRRHGHMHMNMTHKNANM
jgi:hypothetical protein